MATHGNSSRQNTVDGFEKEMMGVVEHIKRVTTPDKTTGRARFPEFKVTMPIKEKLAGAAALLDEGKITAAFNTLDAAVNHFNNQQAAYARRTLLPDLKGDYENMVASIRKGDDDDLEALVRKALEAYETLVGQEIFELEEASKLFWATIDALNSAEEQYAARMKEIKSQKDAAAKKLRDERAQAAKQRTAAVSKGLKDLVSGL